MKSSTPPAASADALIVVQGLHKRYHLGERTVDALRGVSLSITAGTFCAVVGPSGSGKSTLLNLIGLLDTPDAGTIRLDGRDVASLSAAEAARTRRAHLGFVFQDFNLIPVLTAYENVELPLRVGSRRDTAGVRQRRDWVMSLLESVGLADHAGHRPAQLSGGQQQRVAIARALVNRPVVVLADEPTANLDTATGQSILELMHRFNRELSTTFVFSTHDPAVQRLAATTVTLRDGVVTG